MATRGTSDTRGRDTLRDAGTLPPSAATASALTREAHDQCTQLQFEALTKSGVAELTDSSARGSGDAQLVSRLLNASENVLNR